MVESSPIFADGFGRRVVRVSRGDVAPSEHLHIDPVLASHPGFAVALRERVAHLHGRRLTSYARVHGVESDGLGSLGIVSDHVRGWRLADLLDVAESENLTFDLGVVMLLLRQLLPTAALLGTQSRDTASGALGPEHLLLTPQARLVLTDYVLGSAIDALDWPGERLWRTLRVATPAGVEGRAVSPRGDVVQVGLTVLSLIVGRRLRDDEFPERLEDLVTSARQKTPAVIHAPLSAPLRDWLLRALQLQPKSFATLFDAQMALERLLAAEPSLLAQPAELENAVARFGRFMPEFELPVPEPELPLLEAPPPGAVPLAVAFDRVPVPPVESARDGAAAAAVAATQVITPAVRKSGVRKKADRQEKTDQPERIDTAADPAGEWSGPAAPVVSSLVPTAVTTEPPADQVVETAPVDAAVAPAGVISSPSPASVPVPAPFPAASPSQSFPVPASLHSEPLDQVGPAASAPADAPWWRSARAVAALVAVAVGQALLIGWQLSRPTEGLGGDGEVVVQSRPEGATVLIDDRERGVTPLTVRISPGTHVLQLRAGAAEPRIIPLQIRSGVQTAQYVELMGVASTGVLEVRSEPAKAKVTVDGEQRGSTPLTLRDLVPRDYKVVIERAGWKSTQVVRVEPGATAQLVVPIR